MKLFCYSPFYSSSVSTRCNYCS